MNCFMIDDNTVDFILLGLLTLPVSLCGFLSHDFHSVQFIENIDLTLADCPLEWWIHHSLNTWLPHSPIFLQLCFSAWPNPTFSFRSSLPLHSTMRPSDYFGSGESKFGCICSYWYANLSCLVNLWVGCLSFTWEIVNQSHTVLPIEFFRMFSTYQYVFVFVDPKNVWELQWQWFILWLDCHQSWGMYLIFFVRQLVVL